MREGQQRALCASFWTMPLCRPYAEAIANLLDPQGGLFHRVIANSASTDKDGMPVDQLKSFSRVRRDSAVSHSAHMMGLRHHSTSGAQASRHLWNT